MKRKTFRRILAASVAFGVFTFEPNVYQLPIVQIVQAEVKMYSGVGEDYPSQIENLEVSRLRAVDKAVKAAVEKAGVALSAYSRAKNFQLTENEIVAITSNTYQIIGEPKCEKIVHQVTDVSAVVIWRVTVDVNVDDAEIIKWMRLDNNESSKIVSQTQETLKVSAENTAKVENLRQRVKNATTEQEKSELKAEFEQADKEFLANQKLAEGNRYWKYGKFSQAITAFNEAIKFNPNNKEAWKRLGDIHCIFSINDPNKAIKYYAKVIEIDDSNAGDILSRIGLVYQYHLKDKEKSVEYYNKAINIYTKMLIKNPNDTEILKSLGQLYKVIGNKSKSLEYYNKTINIYEEMLIKNPNDVKTLKNLKITYENIGNNDKTLEYKDKILEYYKKAAELEPNNKNIWIELALSSSNLDEIIEYYHKALSISPNDSSIWISLGSKYNSAKNYKKALECYNKAVSIDPEYPSVYSDIAINYKEMKDYDNAILNYQKAIELAPKNVHYWYGLGNCYWAINNYEKSIECYENYLKINPRDTVILSNLVMLYTKKTRNFQKAKECCDKLIELKPNDNLYYKMRGYSCEMLDEIEKAIIDYTKSIEIAPNDSVSYSLRGRCYQKLGDIEKANSDFAKAKELEKAK